VLRYWCSACDLPLAGGRAVTSCPVNPDGQHTPEARSTGGAVRNNHPTVKSVALMRWLVRLVAPPGGVVLDPFAGSGSTGVACVREGVDFVGVEREAVYVAIAEARIAHARGEPS
jgi:site-specific DNA-methyltransferase (adenine-specific)